MNMKYHIETAWKHCIGNIVSLIILTLVVAAVSVISIGILAPVAFAGYTESLFQLLKHNREPKAQHSPPLADHLLSAFYFSNPLQPSFFCLSMKR